VSSGSELIPAPRWDNFKRVDAPPARTIWIVGRFSGFYASTRTPLLEHDKPQLQGMTEDMTDDELNLELERMRAENAKSFADAVKEISEVK
jgi:hypothetical protein